MCAEATKKKKAQIPTTIHTQEKKKKTKNQ
jgi:hypothetical protein